MKGMSSRSSVTSVTNTAILLMERLETVAIVVDTAFIIFVTIVERSFTKGWKDTEKVS